MPKLKTHKPTSKRFRRTKGGKGKLVRTRAGKGHLRRKKRKSLKRKLDRMAPVETRGMRNRVRALLPNLSRLDVEKGKREESEAGPSAKEETSEAT